jgi:hypothetical protein
MKNTKFLFAASVALLGMSMVASATPVPCSNQAVVTGFTCGLGNLTFTFENVSFVGANPGLDALALDTPPTGFSDGVADLGFQVLASYPVDIHLVYEVTSTTSGIFSVDSTFTPAAPPPDPRINESVCSTDPELTEGSCPQANVLAQVNNVTGSIATSGNFGPLSQFWVDKDITDPGFSSFTDSVNVGTVPEPSTSVFLGAAILGLGMISRKLRRA